MLPRPQNHQAVDIVTLPNNQPPKSHHLNSLIRSNKHKKLRNIQTRSLLLPNLQIDLVLLKIHPPFHPTVSNPVPTYHRLAQIHIRQAQQQQQINTETLLPNSSFIANATLQQTPLIPAPEKAPHLIKYSNTPQFSTQPIIFANTNKKSTSELSHLIHTFSKINDTRQDNSLFQKLRILIN